MKIHQDKYLSKKKELSDQNKLTKKQISDAFNVMINFFFLYNLIPVYDWYVINLYFQKELRSKIERKEKEILSNVDAILEENLRSVDSMISLMGNKIAGWGAEIDQINRYTNSRDEVKD